MVYSDFTLPEVVRRFGLSMQQYADMYAGVPSIPISPTLAMQSHEYFPVALSIGTDKARSELIIAPILVEVRKQMNHQISLFSGVDFTVSPEQG